MVLCSFGTCNVPAQAGAVASTRAQTEAGKNRFRRIVWEESDGFMRLLRRFGHIGIISDSSFSQTKSPSSSKPNPKNSPNPQIPIGIVWDVFWESNLVYCKMGSKENEGLYSKKVPRVRAVPRLTPPKEPNPVGGCPVFL